MTNLRNEPYEIRELEFDSYRNGLYQGDNMIACEGEPEDATLYRDYSPLVDLLQREQAARIAAEAAVNAETDLVFRFTDKQRRDAFLSWFCNGGEDDLFYFADSIGAQLDVSYDSALATYGWDGSGVPALLITLDPE